MKWEKDEVWNDVLPEMVREMKWLGHVDLRCDERLTKPQTKQIFESYLSPHMYDSMKNTLMWCKTSFLPSVYI